MFKSFPIKLCYQQTWIGALQKQHKGKEEFKIVKKITFYFLGSGNPTNGGSLYPWTQKNISGLNLAKSIVI